MYATQARSCGDEALVDRLEVRRRLVELQRRMADALRAAAANAQVPSVLPLIVISLKPEQTKVCYPRRSGHRLGLLVHHYSQERMNEFIVRIILWGTPTSAPKWQAPSVSSSCSVAVLNVKR